MQRKARGFMEYRKLPHGEEKISVIGMGSSVVGEQKEEDIIKTVEYALDAGINYFDMAGGHASIFPAYGKVMARRRKEAILQVHFGANYMTGEYGWTPAQCIQYALDKPGVLTVLGGPGNVEQLKEILTYLDTTEKECDYSVIGSFVPDDSVGKKLQKGDIL